MVAHPTTVAIRLQPRRRGLLFRRSGVFNQPTGVNAQNCGSALKFGVIAAGEGDMYPRLRTTWSGAPWPARPSSKPPAAASSLWPAPPLTYGKPGLKNDDFIAWRRR